jgi:peroxiredoxin
VKPLVSPGEQAPDFHLEGSDEKTHSLKEILRESHALLVFYPGNDTPG